EPGPRVRHVPQSSNRPEAEDLESLRFRIAPFPLGGSARLAAFRGGASRDIDIALAAPPEDPPRDLTLLRGNNPLAGATVANLSPALADELGIDTASRGVIVLQVERGSPAGRLGFTNGDVVVSVNKGQVGSVAQLGQLIGDGARQWQISIRRQGKVLSVAVGG